MAGTKKLTLGRRLSNGALWCGLVGVPLWMLSYVWIPFRFAGRETEAVWSVVVAAELGAMLTVVLGTVGGLTARRCSASDERDVRRAASGLKLNAAVFACLVLFNLIGIICFS